MAAQYTDVFAAIPFGTGTRPSEAVPAPAPAPAAGSSDGPDGGIAQLDRFTVVASTGGYLGTNDFLTFSRVEGLIAPVICAAVVNYFYSGFLSLHPEKQSWITF